MPRMLEMGLTHKIQKIKKKKIICSWGVREATKKFSCPATKQKELILRLGNINPTKNVATKLEGVRP